MSAIDHQLGKLDAVSKESGAVQTQLIDRFSLASKLRISIVSNAVILMAISVIVLITVSYYASTGRNIADLAGIEVRTAHASLEISDARFAVRDYRERGSIDAIERVAPALEDARGHLAYSLTWMSDQVAPEHPAAIEALKQRIEAVQSDVSALGAEPDQEALGALEKELASMGDASANYARDLRGTLAPASRDLFSGLAFVISIVAAIVIAAIVFSFVSARVIIGNVVSMMHQITDAMKRLASGDTDSAIPGRDRQDEIGEMARALTVFRTASLALRDLTDERAREAEARLAQQEELNTQALEMRTAQSQLLEGLADGFEVSVGEVISAVHEASEQLNTTSNTMVSLAEGSVTQAREATSAMDDATRNVTAAAAATDEFALSINEISNQASDSAQLARDASSLVTAANTKMTDLSKAAEEIGEIVGLIQTIAQRTNLLALNASIEAARGGEAGRGFAVVASEVKELATQTSHATSSVAEKIAAMQSSTEASASDLTAIVEQIEKLEQASIVIASAVDQQSLSGEELARNIDTVAAGAQHVGERLNALGEASGGTGAAAADVLENAKRLGGHADKLRQKASRFIADVRRSSKQLASSD